MRPIATAPIGLTKPAAGVIATRPATAPDAAPRVVGLPNLSCSTSSQPRIAAAVATVVVVNATPATWLAPRAEPALKPYQPNHSRLAPSSTNGTLCGRPGSRGQPTRLPSTIASARPAAPALMCTAVPPAKSRALRLLAIQPPTTEPSDEENANTQCATGKYTTVAQIAANSVHAQNLARSAIEPEIRATVMIANISWNITNASTGYWCPTGSSGV